MCAIWLLTTILCILVHQSVSSSPLGWMLGDTNSPFRVHGRMLPNNCNPCAAGSYGEGTSPGQGSGCDGCTPCDTGYTTDGDTDDEEDCDRCVFPKYSSNGEGNGEGNVGCADCPTNTINCGFNSFGQCNAGYSSAISGSTLTCTACDSGKYKTEVANSACMTCDTVATSCGGSSFGLCPAAYGYLSPPENKCEPCSLGTFKSTSAKVACALCAKGKYTDQTGSETCQTVPAGYMSVSATNGNSYTSSGAKDIYPCPNGYYNADSEGQCLQVKPGRMPIRNNTFNSSTATGWINCPAGWFNQLGQGPCIEAGIGFVSSFSVAAASVATNTVGTGPNPVRAATNGAPCAFGFFKGTAGAGNCTACAVGYSTAFLNSTSSTACIICKFGYYSTTGKGVAPGNTGCTQCDANAVGCGSSSIGLNTAQGQCKEGYGGVNGNAFCTECVVGQTYKQAIGNEPCTRCDANGCSTATTTSPGVCNAGYTSTDNGVTCLPCEAGFYKAATGNGACTACATGYTTAGGAATAGTSAAACNACGVGYWSATGEGSSQGNSGCSECGEHSTGCGVSALGQNIGPGLCAAGYMGDPALTDGVCTPCRRGTYKPVAGNVFCKLCPEGKYGIIAGSPDLNFCQDAIPGYFSVAGSTEQIQCARSFYSAEVGAGQCLKCPSGTVTTFEGASDSAQCLSPVSNFVQGYVVLVIDLLLVMQYLIRGRFHRVAFLRSHRVLKQLTRDTRAVTSYIQYFNEKASAEHIVEVSYRRLKTWIFLILSFAALTVGVVLFVVGEISSIIFKALIIFKSIDFDFDFAAKVGQFVQDVANAIGSDWVYYLSYPFLSILSFLSNFTIDLSVIAVNCAGATAPFHLLTNMLVLGTAIVFIEGQFQAFKLLVYNSVGEETSDMFSRRVYQMWSQRNRGKNVHITLYGLVRHFFFAFTGFLSNFGMQFDIVHGALQYLMSVVKLSSFIEDNGVHAFDENCNDVAGFVGADESLAYLTSLVFWIMALPGLYSLSRVAVPRLPPGVDSFDEISENTDDFRTYFHLHKILKLFSFVGPDLWLAFFANKHLKHSTVNIPLSSGLYVSSVHDMEVREAKLAASRKETFLAAVKAGDDIETDARMSVKVPARSIHLATVDNVSVPKQSRKQRSALTHTMIQSDHTAPDGKYSRLLRAIERPLHYSFRIVTDATLGYIAFYECKKITWGMKIWSDEVHIDRTASGVKFNLIKISRMTGSVESAVTYDVYKNGEMAEGRNAEALADALNDIGEEYVIVLVFITTAHPESRLDGHLLNAILECGGSESVYDNPNLSGTYILIACGGCGPGNGYEEVMHEEGEFTVDFHTSRHGIGWEIEEELQVHRFIREANMKRSKAENLKWKHLRAKTLPTYSRLCHMEFDEIKHFCFCLPKVVQKMFLPFIALLVTVGLGHILTSVGRKAWWIVAWNYLRFIQVVLGIWTENMVEVYGIHEIVKDKSSVFTHPEFLVALMDYEDDHPEPLSSIAEHARSEGEKIKFYEKHRQLITDLDQRRKLASDYGTALYAAIAPRATLCQLIPYLSVLSIFASFTSRYPVFVYSHYLDANLPEKYIESPFTDARTISLASIAREERICHQETHEESYTVAIPGEETTNRNSQVAPELPPRTIELMKQKNEFSRARQKEVLSQEKEDVREWEVTLNGYSSMLAGSRYINYAKGVFKFVCALCFLFGGDELAKILSVVMVVVLFPFALEGSFEMIVTIGTKEFMMITDKEIDMELGWLFRWYSRTGDYLQSTCIWAKCLSVYCCKCCVNWCVDGRIDKPTYKGSTKKVATALPGSPQHGSGGKGGPRKSVVRHGHEGGIELGELYAENTASWDNDIVHGENMSRMPSVADLDDDFGDLYGDLGDMGTTNPMLSISAKHVMSSDRPAQPSQPPPPPVRPTQPAGSPVDITGYRTKSIGDALTRSSKSGKNKKLKKPMSISIVTENPMQVQEQSQPQRHELSLAEDQTSSKIVGDHTQMFDADGNEYWCHNASGKSVWEHPDPAHPDHASTQVNGPEAEATQTVKEGSDWEVATDEHGNNYYYNHKTGGSSWTLPDTEKEAQSKEASEEDKAVATTANELKADSEWSLTSDVHGTEYYYNYSTGESSWTIPESEIAAVDESTLHLHGFATGIVIRKWAQMNDADGNEYWCHEKTSESVWGVPADVLKSSKYKKYLSEKVLGEMSDV